MSTISLEEYGVKPRTDGASGYILVTPTKQAFVEADGTDVRFDRVRVYGLNGLEESYLRDKMMRRFMDNLDSTEDDLDYLTVLTEKER